MKLLAYLALSVSFLACSGEKAEPILDSAGSETAELKSQEALLEVVLVEEGDVDLPDYEVVLSLANGESNRRPLPPLDELVESWRASILEVDEERTTELGAQLYTALLEPWRDELVGVRRLYWFPRGALQGVALDALPIEECRFVGDLFDVVCGPPARESTAVDGHEPLRVFSTMSATIPGLDYLGPVFRTSSGGGGLLPLFAADHESDSVAEFYVELFGRAALTNDYSGEDKRVFFERAPGASAIHIAGYGTADLGHREKEKTCRCDPHDYSGIAFGGAYGMAIEDDVLTASEVRATDLSNCGLAFLSCGETALRIQREGSESPTMVEAFRDAGARAAIGSLWTVEDENTYRFVMTFYDYYWKRRLPLGRALWSAKRLAMEEGAPSRTWAAWVLTGDASLLALHD